MYISPLGLVVLIVLLTRSSQQIDEACGALFKLALWLAGVIAAGVALWFGYKFCCAHWVGLLASLGVLFVMCVRQMERVQKEKESLSRYWEEHQPRKPIFRDSDFEAWRTARGTK